jgi:hypothetical protein
VGNRWFDEIETGVLNDGMRRILKSLCAVYFVSTMVSTAIGEESRTEVQVVNQFKAAHEEKDFRKIMALFYREGTPELVLKAQESSVAKALALTIKRVVVQPVPAEKKEKFMKGFAYQERVLVPNLDPSMEMVVEFETEDQGVARITSQTVMMGKQGDVYFFVMSKFNDEE